MIVEGTHGETHGEMVALLSDRDLAAGIADALASPSSAIIIPRGLAMASVGNRNCRSNFHWCSKLAGMIHSENLAAQPRAPESGVFSLHAASQASSNCLAQNTGVQPNGVDATKAGTALKYSGPRDAQPQPSSANALADAGSKIDIGGGAGGVPTVCCKRSGRRSFKRDLIGPQFVSHQLKSAQ
jgi:hypothetical protein